MFLKIVFKSFKPSPVILTKISSDEDFSCDEKKSSESDDTDSDECSDGMFNYFTSSRNLVILLLTIESNSVSY